MRHLPAIVASGAGLLALACGSANDSLFHSTGPAGTGGIAGYGGTTVTSGGSANSGGITGYGGTTVTSGGSTSSGGAGSSAGTGGATAMGGSPATCDYSGTWGTYITVPVSWPEAQPILFGGTGTLQQWDLTEQVQQGFDVVSKTVPCMIFLPDLQSSLAGAFAKFGIRFPTELFDREAVPASDFVLHGSLTPTGVSVQTDPFAILVGVTLSNPTTAPWPGTALAAADHDLDGSPGVTVIPETAQGYSLPPVDLIGNVADRIYIAERTVSTLQGPLTTCDDVVLSVDILPVAPATTGIQSSVIGCHVKNGVDCTKAQSDFVDAVRPQYTPTGPGTAVSVRMPAGSKCSDVRARFPAF